MGIFFNFNTKPARQFNYIPRYYDPEKERREELKQTNKSRLQKGFLSQKRENSKFKKSSLQKYSIVRFLLIFLILLGAIYYFLPSIINKIIPAQ